MIGTADNIVRSAADNGSVSDCRVKLQPWSSGPSPGIVPWMRIEDDIVRPYGKCADSPYQRAADSTYQLQTFHVSVHPCSFQVAPCSFQRVYFSFQVAP